MITLDGTVRHGNSIVPESLSAFLDSKGFDPTEPVLVVSDVDSTFIKQEVIDLLAIRAGKGNEVAAITERAMRGEIDFEQSLRSRVETLKGLPESVLKELGNEIEFSEGAIECIRTFHQLGHHFALVSGGFIQILQPMCDLLDISHFKANCLGVSNGSLTGEVEGAIVDAHAKAKFLSQLRDELNVSKSNVIAVGDGANDIPMMQAANISVSFNGKPKVQTIADIHISGPRYDQILTLFN